MQLLLREMNKFGDVSGLKVNLEKTELFWLGPWKTKKTYPKGLKLASPGIKILGIYFSYDKHLKYENNFGIVLNRMQNIIRMFKMRDLSISGKIQVIKSNIMSQLLYVSNAIYVPEEVIKKVNEIIYKFLWNGPDKVKRASIISDICDGGLKFPDFESRVFTQRIKLLQKLLSSEENTWCHIPNAIFNTFGMLSVSIFTGEKPVWYRNKLPDIYSQISDAIHMFKPENIEQYDVEYVVSQHVWYNDLIINNQGPKFIGELQKLGINHIRDLYDEKTGKLHNCCSLRDKGFTENHVLYWHRLIHSLPVYCKKYRNVHFGKSANMALIVGEECRQVNTLSCREIYWALINKKNVYPQQTRHTPTTIMSMSMHGH
jgi:hypothetical protein